jgi:hypothetical protein
MSDRQPPSGPVVADALLGFSPIGADSTAADAPGPIVLAGAPDTETLSRLADAWGVCSDGYRPRLLFVEADARRLEHAIATSPLGDSAPVEQFTGPDAIRLLETWLRERLGDRLPRVVVESATDPLAGERVRAMLASLEQEQERETDRLFNEVERARAGRDEAWWGARYAAALGGSGPALRVLIKSSRYSTFVRHAADGLGDAIERAGHRALVLMEADDATKHAPLARVRAHHGFDPDLVVAINWPRPLLGQGWPGGVPSVCWIQDMMPHLLDERVGRALGPLDFVAGQVHGTLARDFGYPVTNRIFAAVPASESVFARGNAKADARFACDIAYVSHQSETTGSFVERMLIESADAADASRAIRALAPRVVEAASAPGLVACPDLWSLTGRVLSEIGLGTTDRASVDRLYLRFVLPLAERAYRHTTLEWAKTIAERHDLRMRVFGRGWERHPRFAGLAGPAVDFGEDLRAAYASAGCHLHASLQTNAHQRVAECALAGGVMLRRGPTPDRSQIRSEIARLLEAGNGPVRLPHGSVVVHSNAERLAACAPDEIGLGRDGRGEIRRCVLPRGYTLVRPAWVPRTPLGGFPDWAIDRASETMFSTPEQLERCILRAVGGAEWRERTVSSHRGWAREHASFAAFWRRLSGAIRDRLCGDAASDAESDRCDVESPILRRNLAALRTRFPALADRLADHADRGIVRHESGQTLDTMPGHLAQAFAGHASIALHGVGDGSLLRFLIERPVGENGRRTGVHIVEPSLDRLLGVLHSMDLSGQSGPLAGDDVEWYIGDDWEQQVLLRFETHPALPLPRMVLAPDPRAGIGEAVWHRVAQRCEAEQRALDERIAAWLDYRDTEESWRALRGESGRPARALVVTSRFTTVLQHSARSVVRALERSGWEAELLIEPRDHDRLTVLAASRAIDRVKPDVAFSIDHHRTSIPGFPDRIPFVCWIQDDLPHLISDRAANGIGPLDFVTGAWMSRYIQQWGYPSSACVSIPRLTDTREVLEPDPAFAGIDLCYVSNAGRSAGGVMDEFAAGVDRSSQTGRVFMDACERLIGLYDEGGSAILPREIASLIRSSAEKLGVGPITERWVSDQAELIQLKLNNVLFRQQGLSWAADIANEQGLTLAIFGDGWREHPRFAKYARGRVGYGEPLAALTRTAKINLRLEPYPPTSHQRLLDALAAGGFVLSRSYGDWHEAEHRLVGFFFEYIAGRFKTVDAIRERVGATEVERLWELAEALAPAIGLDGPEAVVQRYLDRERNGLLEDYTHAPLPPRYFETVFRDQDSLRSLITRHLSDRRGMDALRMEQGAFVRDRYGYTANMQRLMREVGDRLLGRRKAAVA